MIRLSQGEYNRLSDIENFAGVLFDFIENTLKPDWPAHKDDADMKYSRALYAHIRMSQLLSKPLSEVD
jgi:hypothetical protein